MKCVQWEDRIYWDGPSIHVCVQWAPALPAVGPVVPPIDDISHGGWPGEGSGPPGIEYPPGETFGESSSEE